MVRHSVGPQRATYLSAFSSTRARRSARRAAVRSPPASRHAHSHCTRPEHVVGHRYLLSHDRRTSKPARGASSTYRCARDAAALLRGSRPASHHLHSRAPPRRQPQTPKQGARRHVERQGRLPDEEGGPGAKQECVGAPQAAPPAPSPLSARARRGFSPAPRPRRRNGAASDVEQANKQVQVLL